MAVHLFGALSQPKGHVSGLFLLKKPLERLGSELVLALMASKGLERG